MNQIDIYARMQVNREHIEEMLHEAQAWNESAQVEKEGPHRRNGLDRGHLIALAVSVLLAGSAALVIVSKLGLLPAG